MKKWFYLCAAALGLSACIYPYDVQLDSTETEKVLVVDGNIVAGGVSTVYLSYMIPFSSDGWSFSLPENGKVWIEDETGKQYPGYQAGTLSPSFDYSSSTYEPVYYRGSNVPFIISTEDAGSGHQYRVVVEADGETYVSGWQKPSPVPEITDVYFEADDHNVYVYVDLEKAAADGSGYLGFTFDETWEFHVDYDPEWFIDTKGWFYYQDLFYQNPNVWCFQSVSSPRRILVDYTSLDQGQVKHYLVTSFPRTNNRNHRRYSINVKATSMDREAFLYNRQTQQQSQGGGDLFTPDPGAIAGNLRCESDPRKQVMGMVVTGESTSRRGWLGNQYSLYRPMTVSWVFPENVKQMQELYYNGASFRPVMEVTVDDESKIGWGPLSCIDCVAAGGTKERPDFWEN